MKVLDPGVVLRADFGPKHPQRSVVIRGPAELAGSALTGAGLAGAGLAGAELLPALVNGQSQL